MALLRPYLQFARLLILCKLKLFATDLLDPGFSALHDVFYLFLHAFVSQRHVQFIQNVFKQLFVWRLCCFICHTAPPFNYRQQGFFTLLPLLIPYAVAAVCAAKNSAITSDFVVFVIA